MVGLGWVRFDDFPNLESSPIFGCELAAVSFREGNPQIALAIEVLTSGIGSMLLFHHFCWNILLEFLIDFFLVVSFR